MGYNKKKCKIKNILYYYFFFVADFFAAAFFFAAMIDKLFYFDFYMIHQTNYTIFTISEKYFFREKISDR